MKITLEQIDLLRKRANISYESAKEALEKFQGDIVEALIYLEKENKIKAKAKDPCKNQFIERLKCILKKGNETKLVIKKNTDTVLNIPITLAVVLSIFATPFVLLGLAAVILTKHKICIQKRHGENLEVNKIFDKMSKAVNNMTSESSIDLNKK